ncbi:hypothetical protein MNB_SV-15-292 [hydrothermal vent metagenome]|uniref:Uncharacterized protein n=1 Tax=hydrothermal vent metagenome TaxID=652676 RepID=A0A1W1EIK2_9ZZZZ
MDSKKVLILLVVFTILVNFINYVDVDESKYIKKIELLTKRVAKEKALLGKQIKVLDINKSSQLFFDAKVDNNILLGKFQKMIKDIAKKSNFKITHTSWGTPTLNKKLNIFILPIKIDATSTPHNFAKFSEYIINMDKIVKLDMLSIRKSRKKLSYRMYLFAYKRVSSEK